jgi:lysyl oxidase
MMLRGAYPGGASRRLAILAIAAATIPVLVGATLAPNAGAGSQSRLLPDLITMRISQQDIVLHPSGAKLFLRLSNEIGNRGRGPLEIYPSDQSNDCDGDGNPDNDRDTYQRIFLDSTGDGGFARGQDAQSEHHLFGCERYHPAHRHWHLLDFSRYKLVRERTGRTVARSTKIGFCIIDTDRAFPGLPGVPTAGYYPAASGDCSEDSIDGLSVGWADTYNYLLPGQYLNVTGLGRGRYCLVSTADPNNLLRESNNSNNARRTRIALHPAEQTIERLPEPCRSS